MLLSRLSAVEPDLSALDIVPSLEQDLPQRLRELVRGKDQQKRTASDRHRQEASQISRLQAQQEELE